MTKRLLGDIEPGGLDSFLIIVTKDKTDFAASPSFMHSGIKSMSMSAYVSTAFTHTHLQNFTSSQTDSVPGNPDSCLSPAPAMVLALLHHVPLSLKLWVLAVNGI